MKPTAILIYIWLQVLSLYAQEQVVLQRIGDEKHHQFGLVPYQNGWVYVTDENTLTWASRVNLNQQNLYRLVGIDSGFTHRTGLKGLSFNTVNVGPIVFYANDTKAVVTRNLEASSKQKAKLGLFFMHLDEEEWKEEGAFLYNQAGSSTGHAAINSRGDTLIFCSDRPGGAGGTDLYMSVLQNNVWSQPVNLKALNSPQNEMFPFLHRSGRLFFSSDRDGGRGGLDVYSTSSAYPYHEIKALDDVINSTFDDFAYWCSEDEQTGVLSSDRNGYDALYSFSQWIPEFRNCVTWEPTILCYEFYEEATVDVGAMPLVYEWDFGDGFKKKSLQADHCYKEPGTYTVQLNVMDTVIKKLYMNEATYELEITEAEQPLIDYRINETKLELEASAGTWKQYPIEGIYWKTGGVVSKGPVCQATMSNDSLNVYLLIKSKDNQVHCFQRMIKVDEKTDGVITQVEEFKKGETSKPVVEKEDEVYRLVLNESAERTSIDKEHFKDLYTRVSEYYFPTDSLYRYTIGEAKHPLELKPVYDQAHKAGFEKAYVEELPLSIESTSKYEVSRTALTDIDERRLDSLLGSTFELQLGFFDYNKTNIKPECEPPLNVLALYLAKHPGYTLEITAHTDDRGPDRFNEELSQKRAESVYAYLVARNIDPKRLTKKGHGETYPKYPNTTDENRARNRRVEFRILK